MLDLLIKNARVVNADSEMVCHIGIKHGKIVNLMDVSENPPAEEMIDAGMKTVIPGVIDAHMHVQAPFQGMTGQLTFYQQSICAAFGGVTTFMDFTNTWKGGSVLEAFHQRKAEMAESAIDYSVHGKIVEGTDAVLNELPQLVAAGCPSFKMFMTYEKEGVMSSDETLIRVMRQAKSLRFLPMVHAESNSIAKINTEDKLNHQAQTWCDFAESKPIACESEAFQRAVSLARFADSPLLVVHTTNGECLKTAKAAQAEGFPIYVETCPQYLFLNDSIYQKPDEGHLAICSPPLRDASQAQPLKDGIADGTICITGSDDCTFTRAEKEQFLERNSDGQIIQDFTKVVNGTSGLELRLKLLNKVLDWNRLVAVTSTNVARLFGCYPQKGIIAIGSDADLVIISEKPGVICADDLHNGCDYTLYAGIETNIEIDVTISRGEIIMRDKQFLGKKGRGKFIHRIMNNGLLSEYNNFFMEK